MKSKILYDMTSLGVESVIPHFRTKKFYDREQSRICYNYYMLYTEVHQYSYTKFLPQFSSVEGGQHFESESIMSLTVGDEARSVMCRGCKRPDVENREEVCGASETVDIVPVGRGYHS